MTDEFKACRGPNCRYKAPVCQYGYCGQCCRRHHNYASVGALANHKMPAWGEGFKVIEHGYTKPEEKKNEAPATVEKPVVVTPPVCGDLTEVLVRDYPIEDSTNRYYHQF